MRPKHRRRFRVQAARIAPGQRPGLSIDATGSPKRKRRQARWTEIPRMPSGRDGGLTPLGPTGAPKRRLPIPVRAGRVVLRPATRRFPAEEPSTRLAATPLLAKRRARGSPVASRASPGSDRRGRGTSAATAPPTRTTPSGAAPCRPTERSAPRGGQSASPVAGPMPARGSPSASLRSRALPRSRLDRPPPRDPCGPRDDPGTPASRFPATVASRRRRPASGLRTFLRAAFRVPEPLAYRLHDPSSMDGRQPHSREAAQISVHKDQRSLHPIHGDPQRYPHAREGRVRWPR